MGLPKDAIWNPPKPTHGIGTKNQILTVKDAIHDLPRLGSGEIKIEYSGTPESQLAKRLRGNQKILLNHEAPNHPQETIDRIRNTKPGEPMYESFQQRIRLHWNQPSPTQVSGGIRPQFQFGHPSQARGLSIREMQTSNFSRLNLGCWRPDSGKSPDWKCSSTNIGYAYCKCNKEIAKNLDRIECGHYHLACQRLRIFRRMVNQLHKPKEIQILGKSHL